MFQTLGWGMPCLWHFMFLMFTVFFSLLTRWALWVPALPVAPPTVRQPALLAHAGTIQGQFYRTEAAPWGENVAHVPGDEVRAAGQGQMRTSQWLLTQNGEYHFVRGGFQQKLVSFATCVVREHPKRKLTALDDARCAPASPFSLKSM